MVGLAAEAVMADLLLPESRVSGAQLAARNQLSIRLRTVPCCDPFSSLHSPPPCLFVVGTGGDSLVAHITHTEIEKLVQHPLTLFLSPSSF